MTAELVIMQGDQYALPIELMAKDGTPLSPDTLADVEVVVGTMRKTMSRGAIVYDAERGVFLFPLTQEETFAMRDQRYKVQLRVKTTGGDVVGIYLGEIIVDMSKSKEVL